MSYLSFSLVNFTWILDCIYPLKFGIGLEFMLPKYYTNKNKISRSWNVGRKKIKEKRKRNIEIIWTNIYLKDPHDKSSLQKRMTVQA